MISFPLNKKDLNILLVKLFAITLLQVSVIGAISFGLSSMLLSNNGIIFIVTALAVACALRACLRFAFAEKVYLFFKRKSNLLCEVEVPIFAIPFFSSFFTMKTSYNYIELNANRSFPLKEVSGVTPVCSLVVLGEYTVTDPKKYFKNSNVPSFSAEILGIMKSYAVKNYEKYLGKEENSMKDEMKDALDFISNKYGVLFSEKSSLEVLITAKA